MESASIKRRLTAILAADAVNYSRHMGEDEEGTLRQLAAHRAVIDRIIEAHEGRIVGTAGDSVLAEFASPVEAVRCAVEIQEGVHTRNETLPEAQRLEFRIGVNLGDVMIDGADILGDGVNVAARLEGIADPGGICISSSVYDQIAGKLSLGFVDLGEQALKNIARPIRVYQFDRSGAFVGAKRSGAARRRTGAIVVGVAVVALAAFGAWRAGWLGGTAEPPRAPPPVPVAAVPSSPSEEMKLKLQIAEAERAKAEAELARSRSDNDAAKQRADAELAKQRAASRVVAEKKDATVPANAAPAASPPGTVAGVATGALPATASGPVPAVPAQAAAVPVPASVASVSAPSPAAPAAASTTVASAAPASAFVPVMSGSGTATRECDGFEEMRAFTENRFSVRVDAGNISVERGTQGQVGYMIVQGRPSSDGRLTLVGTAIAANKRNLGKEINVYFSGAYADGAFALTGRTGSRPCRLTVRLDRRP